MIADLEQLCLLFHGRVVQAKRNEQLSQELATPDANGTAKELIYYDESVSMLERTAYRILPII
jgi:hypothetical protein